MQNLKANKQGSISKTFRGWLYNSQKHLQKWDWKAILICFFTAFVFWVFHSLNAEHTTSIELPIQLVYDHKTVAVITAPPSHIKVNVTGYGWNLLSKSFGFRLKPIEISTDFPLSKQYLTAQSLLPSITNGVKELKVNHILQDSIFFKLDTLIHRTVPVIINTSKLRLPYHLRVSSAVFTIPDSVVLYGPASIIDSSVFAEGVPLLYDFEVPNNEFSQSVPLEKPPVAIKLLTKNVLLRFNLAEYKVEHTRLKIEILHKPKSSTARLNPEFAYVEYLLREGDTPLDHRNAIIFVDYQQIDWSDSTVNAKLDMPIKYIEPKVVPTKFKVTFE